MLVPTAEEAKVPTAVPVNDTSSVPTIPTNDGVPLKVAVVFPSKFLLLAVNPEVVKFLGVTVKV